MSLNKCLLAGVKIVEGLNIPYFLTGGTLLGIYRGGELMEWDNDVDIDVFIEDLPKEKVDMLMNDYKFKNSASTIRPGHLVKRFYNIGFDIFVLHKKNGKRFRNVYRDNCMWFPEHLYEKKSEIEYLGRKFPIVAKTEEWMIHFYGEDWKTPIKEWEWSKNTRSACQLKDI